MPRDIEWKHIVQELEQAVRAGAIDPIELLVADEWERESRDRVTAALVDGMGARYRYDTDPLFHRVIESIAQIAAYAIFDKPLVTEEERGARVKDFDRALLLASPLVRPEGLG